MALPSTLTWEIRSTGNAANGGGFDSLYALTGTDRSMSDNPFVTFDGATITATTAGAGNTITITGYTVVAGDVGNIVNITGGTNFVVGRYSITSVSTGSNTWTLQGAAANAATGAGAAMTGRMGGAVASPNTISSVVVTSNTVWIKSGTYNITVTPNFSAGATPSVSVLMSRFIGYGTVRGDNVRVNFTCSGNPGNVLQFGIGWFIANLDIDCSANIGSGGISASSRCYITNCKIYNFKSIGISTAVGLVCDACEVTGGLSGATSCITNGSQPGVISNCYVHDNLAPAIITGPASIFGNIIVFNSGSSSDAINVQEYASITNNLIYGNGRHGVYRSSANVGAITVKNNLIGGNGGFGLQPAISSGIAAQSCFDGNVYWNNASGNRNFCDDFNLTYQYNNPLDRILTENPFVNLAAKDFRLNTLAGGGALCLGLGVPQTFPGLTYSTYEDIGPLSQRRIIRNIGNNGGYNS